MPGRMAAHRAWMPSHARYAAPAHLSAVNAGLDATSRAATPALAATVQTA